MSLARSVPSHIICLNLLSSCGCSILFLIVLQREELLSMVLVAHSVYFRFSIYWLSHEMHIRYTFCTVDVILSGELFIRSLPNLLNTTPCVIQLCSFHIPAQATSH